MTPPRVPQQPKRSRFPLIAAATAALPAVMFSSLAPAQPAQAQSPARPLPATLQAAIEAQAAAATATIPAAAVSAALPKAFLPAAPSTPLEHTVVRGDTVSAIAAKFGLKTADVLSLNKLSVNSIIYPGQKIKLTGQASSASPSPAPAPSAAAGYTVRSGDTLSGIAAKHGVSLSDLLAWNQLSPTKFIHPGQHIKVSAQATPSVAAAPAPAPASSAPAAPATPAGAATYTVRAGDTLSGIAAKHGVSLANILGWNQLSATKIIYPGQQIKVSSQPGGTTPTPAAPTAPTPALVPAAAPAALSPAPTAASYTVRAGDTLSGIAAKHGVSLSDLLAWNQLSATKMIHPGQQLKLNGQQSAPSTIAPLQTTPNVVPLVPSSFLGFEYPAAVVNSANANKALLNAAPVPSRDEMRAIVANTARSIGVDPSLALAVAFQESSFNHRSVSPANAIGTMQVIPSSGQWASEIVGRPLNLLDPQDNATAGVAIIGRLVATSSSLENAIAGYYQGQYSVSKNGMYDDTKHYVAAILAHQKNFR